MCYQPNPLRQDMVLGSCTISEGMKQEGCRHFKRRNNTHAEFAPSLSSAMIIGSSCNSSPLLPELLCRPPLCPVWAKGSNLLVCCPEVDQSLTDISTHFTPHIWSATTILSSHKSCEGSSWLCKEYLSGPHHSSTSFCRSDNTIMSRASFPLPSKWCRCMSEWSSLLIHASGLLRRCSESLSQTRLKFLCSPWWKLKGGSEHPRSWHAVHVSSANCSEVGRASRSLCPHTFQHSSRMTSGEIKEFVRVRF